MNAILLVLLLGQDSVETIMARVAENQDRAQQARTQWVHDQNVFIRLNRGGGKLAREESRDYVVAPGPKGIEKDLKRLSGRVNRRGRILEFSDPKDVEKTVDIDAELSKELSEEFASSKNGKDGVNPDLFPLSGKEQEKYFFHLEGRERYRDMDVFKITFKPRPGLEEGAMWNGEALIHCQEYQPLLVTTTMALRIPRAVQIVLGTNVRHLGFKISYQKVDEGVWFPVKWGGEFQVRALFLYGRTISLAVQNSEFRRAQVESTVTFKNPPE